MVNNQPDDEKRDERLRQWYLARLRKGAIGTKSQLRLTPAALINADRQRMEELITSRAAGLESNVEDIPSYSLYVWLVGTVVALLALLPSAGFDPGNAIGMLFDSTWGTLFSLAVNSSKPAHAVQFSWLITIFYFGWPCWWLLVRPLDKFFAKSAPRR